MDLEAVIARN